MKHQWQIDELEAHFTLYPPELWVLAISALRYTLRHPRWQFILVVRHKIN
jgi:hypothetical protein